MFLKVGRVIHFCSKIASQCLLRDTAKSDMYSKLNLFLAVEKKWLKFCYKKVKHPPFVHLIAVCRMKGSEDSSFNNNLNLLMFFDE